LGDQSLVRLDSLASLVNEKVTTSKDSSMPYVGLEHLPSGGSSLLGSAESGQSVSTNNIFRRGDVLFGKLRPRLRKAVRAPFDGYCSTDILVLRPTASDPGFAGFVLRSDAVFAEAIRTEEGTKMPRCSWHTLKRLRVYCPEPRQQERIAQILSTVDEAIEQTGALIAKTQQIKIGLTHELFTRGVTADGKLRPPYEEARQLYKESPLGWIPREWEVGHLVDRRAPSRAHIKTGPFGSSLKLEHWVDEGVPVITIGALGEGEFMRSQLLHVSEATAGRLREYRLSEGDIVFSRVADVGRSAVITAGETGWIMSSNLMRISLDGTRVVSALLQAQLAYDSRVRAQIRSTVNAGGRDVANSAILNRLHFWWPQFSEQQCIVACLEAFERRRRWAVEELAKLRQLKAGLMHVLLSGYART
jgi:type I restriction enzyme, S subunit